jgi:hypothetical protein
MLAAGIVLIMFARRVEEWAGQYVTGTFSADMWPVHGGGGGLQRKMGAAGAFGMLKKI